VTVQTGGLTTAGLKSTQSAAQQTSAYAIGLDKRFDWQTVTKTVVIEFALGTALGYLNGLISTKIASAGVKNIADDVGREFVEQMVPLSKKVLAGIVADVLELTSKTLVVTTISHLYQKYSATGEKMKGKTFIDKLADALLSETAFRDLLLKTATRGLNKGSGKSYVSPGDDPGGGISAPSGQR
jgi:hypothetical protein